MDTQMHTRKRRQITNRNDWYDTNNMPQLLFTHYVTHIDDMIMLLLQYTICNSQSQAEHWLYDFRTYEDEKKLYNSTTSTTTEY